MSLKDVIMTLNEFYSVKLEHVHKFISLIKSPTKETPENIDRIEKVVKDNEVRIPYDEDIFIGIDKNYKTLKRILVTVKEVYSSKFQDQTQYESSLHTLTTQLETLKFELTQTEKSHKDEISILQTDIEILRS